jgi:hypothetical protein
VEPSLHHLCSLQAWWEVNGTSQLTSCLVPAGVMTRLKELGPLGPMG